MESITVVLQDTGEEMVFEYEDRMEMEIRYGDHILGANILEGRPETTYWYDIDKREAYRLACLEKLSG